MAPKKISRLFRLAASITLFVFTLSALWQAPAQAFFFGGVSLKDEKEMGHKFDVMIRSNLPIVQDPEVSEYVRYLVERIASYIHCLLYTSPTPRDNRQSPLPCYW